MLLLLGEDERPVAEDVELARAPRCGRGVESVSVELGRETRGPAVVAASDGAIEDFDGHAGRLAGLLLRAIGVRRRRAHTATVAGERVYANQVVRRKPVGSAAGVSCFRSERDRDAARLQRGRGLLPRLAEHVRADDGVGAQVTALARLAPG